MVLANMVCSRLCEELWLFFFFVCLLLAPGGPVGGQSKAEMIQTSSVRPSGVCVQGVPTLKMCRIGKYIPDVSDKERRAST